MKKILGLDIEEKPFEYEKELPLYIRGNYTCSKVSAADFDFILMKPEGSMGTAESMRKHLATVQKICGMPAAINPDHISAYRRNSFLEHRVPFITEKQIFLPFLGAYLEKCSEADVKPDNLTAAAQVALIRWLLEPSERIRVKDLMEGLGYTTMTESRVAKQLSSTDCFDLEKDGVANVIVSKYPAKETFERMREIMTSPVDAAGYIDLPTDWDVTIAGTEALSERTMANPDKVHTYAVFGADRKALRNELVDPEKQAYIEIWKYDPKFLLWKDGFADPVSIALSLQDTEDERIEAAVDEMLKALWR